MKSIVSWLRAARRVALCFLWILLTYLAPHDVYAQSARDTAHKTTCDDRMASALKTEANRSNVRKGVVRAVADTLTRCGVALVAPVVQPPPPNKPPVAAIASSCADVTRICSFNAGGATDDKGVVGYTWSFGDGTSASGVTVSHTYPPGTFTTTLTVRDQEGLTSSASRSVTFATPAPDSVVVESPDTTTSIAAPADLPRAVPNPVFAKATRTTFVPAGADLQAALTAAQPGDSLVLAAGATWTGNYVLPTRACGAGITVTTGTTLPPAGTRVTPTTAARFAKIVTPNSAAALKTTNPTCGWRLVGLEIAASASAGVPGTSLNYGILWIGDGGWLGGGETVRSVATQPRDILLDRVYIHGATTTNTTRCLYLNAGAAVVRDSYLSECHAVGSDAQAILLCNGTGPTLIENNALQGSAENFMAGGCDPVSAELIPSDITIRRNHIEKPLAWRQQGWLIKNLFELKNARRVLVEANVFTHTWIAGQMGMAIVLKSSTETCAACTFEGTKDVTFRYNVVRYSHRGLNLQAIDASSAGTTASHTERITVTDNLFDQIGASNGIQPSDGWLMLLTHDLRDVTIQRNTFIGNTPGYGLAVYVAYGGGGQRLDIRDNILAGQSYYAIGGDNGLHATALTNAYGTSWRFTGNVVSQVEGQFAALSPAGNTYLDAIAKLGLRADGSSANYPNAGVSMSTLLQRTAGVVVSP